MVERKSTKQVILLWSETEARKSLLYHVQFHWLSSSNLLLHLHRSVRVCDYKVETKSVKEFFTFLSREL